LLAGRKLLLADDSITIQKVVDLTFADEGVKVVAVGNGREAIERLEEVAPDVVLADVFMPEMNGYEVCEYIKQNEKLSKIPVILLVGSFEPFDEAEARRVGADDILTKPFQSIRRLIEKVGALVGDRPAELEATTVEMPRPAAASAEPEKLSTEEIRVTTADTRPLIRDSGTLREPVAGELESQPPYKEDREYALSKNWNQNMSSKMTESYSEPSEEVGDLLLDLGEFEPTPKDDDVVLDLGFEEAVVEVADAGHAYAPSSGWETESGSWQESGEEAASLSESEQSRPASSTMGDHMVRTQEWLRESDSPAVETALAATVEMPRHEPQSATSSARAGQITADELSPEAIDAIARRVVEQLSEKVVAEIAWEVVPQLSELLIKRRLEEKEQTK